ncbi:glycine receptor subunit alpha-2-like [Lineus longissimus]|uniref:glycine receptor subunit alpha-2-like n=1 Tax=Lineus longissimus TaxID=88925 RepID=UPI00315D66C4
MLLWIVTCLFLLIRPSIAADNDTIQTLLDEMLTNYDKRIRPGQDAGQATKVTFDMFISEFSSVNENSMDYSINLYFRQRWVDPRLAYDDISTPITLGYARVNEIWVPDTFFVNEKRSIRHEVTVPNVLLRVHPDGSLLYSQRISLTLSCPMFLVRYPMDMQQCPMKLESYGYTTKEVMFDWTSKTPVVVNEEVELPEFEIGRKIIDLSNCTVSYNTGSYSCLQVKFKLTRLFGFYITGTYIPSILIVLLSFISFFVDVRATPARISLGLLTVLSITTMNSSVSSSMAKVAYSKAIDLWMAVCLCFVFLALLEFAIANQLARREDKEESAKKEKAQAKFMKVAMVVRNRNRSRNRIHAEDNKNGTDPMDSDDPQTSEPEDLTPAKQRYWTSSRIEKISKWAFPSAFGIFNMIYWVIYLAF